MIKKYIYGSLAVLLLSTYEIKASDNHPINPVSMDNQIKINQRHLVIQNKEIERDTLDNKQNHTHISDIPDEILLKTFMFLPENELRTVFETCKKFAAITQEIGKKYSLTIGMRNFDPVPPEYFTRTIYVYDKDILPENNRDNLKDFHINNKDKINSISLKTEIINKVPRLIISPEKLILTGYMPQQLSIELPYFSQTISLKLRNDSMYISNIYLELSLVEDAMLGGSYILGINQVKYS